MRYELQFWEDYRSHSSHNFIDKAEDKYDEYDDTSYGEFEIEELPLSNIRRYYLIFPDNPNLECVFVTETKDTNNHTILLQIHSYLNKCGPFKVTGMTSSYKDEGSYTEPIEVVDVSIKNFETPQNMIKPTIAIEVDCKGNILDSISILPYA